MVDSLKASIILDESEQWFNASEQNIDFKINELQNSAKVIKETIERLEQNK